jgi:presenilin-like A22 family membrane protease
MNQRRRAVLASSGIVLIFLLVQVGALALVEPFKQRGHQFVTDTSDPTISVLYIAAILVATAGMLAAFRYGVDKLIKILVVFSGAYIAWFVFQVLFPVVTLGALGPVNLLALAGAIVLGVALYVYPEWYVIDAAGIVMGIGAAAIFGINFGILPALVLLSALAIYDAISVYGTKHMLTLASGVMNLRIPVMLVIPMTLSYSFLDAEPPEPVSDDESSESGEETSETGGSSEEMAGDVATNGGEGDAEDDEDGAGALDRDALFIGLGDAVIPTVLVASAGFFVTGVPVVSSLGLSVPVPALTAMAGTIAGLVVLLWMVLKGRAHAGLPLLNGGAIGGYLAGALVSGIPLLEALGLAGFF